MQQLPQVCLAVACLLSLASGLYGPRIHAATHHKEHVHRQHVESQIVSYDASPELMDHVSFIESDKSPPFERSKMPTNDLVGNQSILSTSKSGYQTPTNDLVGNQSIVDTSKSDFSIPTNDFAANESFSLVVAHGIANGSDEVSLSHSLWNDDTREHPIKRTQRWLAVGRESYRHDDHEDHFDSKFDINVGFWLAFGIGVLGFCFIHTYIMFKYGHNEPMAVSTIFVLILCMAVAFDIFVFKTLGVEAGIMWVDGFLQEIVFAMENIFAFFTIIKDFDVPRRLTTKVIFWVVIGQITFQGLLFVGYAEELESLRWLPYVLGAWLIYMGVAAILEHEHHDGEDENAVDHPKFQERLSVSTLSWIFGDRIVMDYADHSFWTSHNGKYCVTLLLPVFILVLLTDFFLECDVTLTKMETLSDKYIEWTSSTFAAFALPEFFFVVRFLCEKYFALPYGIAFVLIFFGTELMLCDLIIIPGLLGICIILSVVFSCIAVSVILTEKEHISKDPDFTPKPDHDLPADFGTGPAESLLEDSGKKSSNCVTQ